MLGLIATAGIHTPVDLLNVQGGGVVGCLSLTLGYMQRICDALGFECVVVSQGV